MLGVLGYSNRSASWELHAVGTASQKAWCSQESCKAREEPAPPPPGSVTLGSSLDLSEPWFPHHEEVGNRRLCLVGLSWGLNKTVHLKHMSRYTVGARSVLATTAVS